MSSKEVPRRGAYTRGHSPHPGIEITSPKRDARGRPIPGRRYALRIAAQSALAAKFRGVIPHEHHATAAQRKAYAMHVWAQLAAAARVEVVSGPLIRAEIDRYLESCDTLRPHTVRSYRTSLTAFAQWAEARGVTQLSQLDRMTLSDWVEALGRMPSQRGGGVRLSSSRNAMIKPLRQMLRRARRTGRLPLDREAVDDALERLRERTPDPRCMSPVEIRALLTAALEADKALRPYACKRRKTNTAAPVAPALALLLLSGMRRRELIGLRVEHVLLDAPTPHGRTVDLIELPAQLSKTRRARDIDANASPLMAKLLRALVKGRAPHESLLGLNYGQLGFRLEGLRRVRGAPKISIKTLRSTCATYQLPLPTDLKRKADRLGHGVAVAARHYQSSPRGLPEQTESLEEAMGCAAELEKVIEACSVRCYA